ncbi:HAD family hydrolase [Arenicellales bacterium nBUS_48]
MNIEIFDLDGTILDSKKAMKEVFLSMDGASAGRLSQEVVWDKYVSAGGEELIQAAFPNAVTSVSALLEVFRDRYLSRTHCADDLFVNAYNAIQNLKKNGAFLCLVTNKPRLLTSKILKETSIDLIFDFTWCRSEHGLKKPSVELAQYLKSKFPKQGIGSVNYYGDSESDFLMSKYLGNCQYHHHEYGFELVSGAERVFNFKQLAMR